MIRTATIIGLMLSAAVAAFPICADEPDESSDSQRPIKMQIKVDPAFAHRIAKQYSEVLKNHYSLSDEQAHRLEAAMSKRFLSEAAKNEKACQALLEVTLSGMATNYGQWTPDAATEFAKQIQTELPALKKAFGGFVDDMKAEFTFKQKAQLMLDYAAFNVEFTRFEGRMKKWTDGQIGEYPNLFWTDPAEDIPPTMPDGKAETKQVRQARAESKRRAEWLLKYGDDWEEYVNRAKKSYGFTDRQMESAHAILKECRQRLASMNSPERIREFERIEFLTQLINRSHKEEIQRGPFANEIYQQDRIFWQPYYDLYREFERRINGLADSTQRKRHEETVWAELRKLGYDGPRL